MRSSDWRSDGCSSDLPDRRMSLSARSWLRAGLVAAIVVALDQVTKALGRADIDPFETKEVVSFIDLVHVRNRGVAFGQLDGGGAVVFVIVALAQIGSGACRERGCQ